MSGYRALIGKVAPSFKLKNYDGEDYEVNPGKTGLPLVIFFYPESGKSIYSQADLQEVRSSCINVQPSLFRIVWVHKASLSVQGCSCRWVTVSCLATDQGSAESPWWTEKVDFSPDKIQIIGISPDPVEKQKAFVEKEKLTVSSDLIGYDRQSLGFLSSMFVQYPILSDDSKKVFELYGIGRGMWGLVKVARVTFVIDREGVVKYVQFENQGYVANGSIDRDALEGTMNYGAHAKFVEDWLGKLNEGKA